MTLSQQGLRLMVSVTLTCQLNTNLTNRQQRVKIGSTLGEWVDVLTGVPQV